jgi:hypothetical protein
MVRPLHTQVTYLVSTLPTIHGKEHLSLRLLGRQVDTTLTLDIYVVAMLLAVAFKVQCTYNNSAIWAASHKRLRRALLLVLLSKSTR